MAQSLLQSGRIFEQKDIENGSKSFVVNAAFLDQGSGWIV